MEELEERIWDMVIKIPIKSTGVVSAEIAKEIRDIATSFARWIKKEGCIYAGEGDYLCPDADGLIGGGYLFDEFIKERYKL